MIKNNWIWLSLIAIQAVRMIFFEAPKLYQDSLPQAILFSGFLFFSILFLWLFNKFKINKPNVFSKTANGIVGIIVILVLPVALSTFVIMQTNQFQNKIETVPKQENNKMDRIQVELNAGSFFIHLKTYCAMNLKKPNQEEIERILQDIHLSDAIKVLDVSIDENFECGGKLQLKDKKNKTSIATLQTGAEVTELIIE
ncbi:hypothetical protein N9N67_05905 [Bacteriovoracaceae bacterium]|nr:hypothetical protein [Bacteriovoracaceae bacterium]